MKRHIISTLGLLVLLVTALVPSVSHAQSATTADLGITRVSYRHVAKAGQLVTFRIVAGNNGPDASQLDVEMLTSANLEPVAYICDFGVSPDTPFCEYSNVSPGTSTTTVLVARLLDTSDTTFSLAVNLSNEGQSADPNSANDSIVVNGRVH